MPGSLLLIAVVWIVLLTPLVLFNRRPVRQTSEALTETRLVHSGGSELRGKRRLRPSPALFTADDNDEELELVDAEPEYVLLDDEGTESKERTPGKDMAVVRQDKGDIDVVEGEVIDGDMAEESELSATGDVNDEAAVESSAQDHAEADDETAESETSDGDIADDAPAGDVSTTTTEDKTDSDVASLKDGNNETGTARKLDASSYKSQDETDTGEFEPVVEEAVVAALKRKKAEKPAEVPTGVLRGVDFDDSRGREDHVRELATVGTARPVENLYDSMELSEDDMNYIAARRGRGVYDPVASAEANRRRQKRRKHVLLGMVALLVLSFALAFWRGGAMWLAPVVMTAMTVFYLVALRKNAIEEAKLRRRRLARMRRARLGVHNTEDHELGVIPERLMRPGAVIIEPDEADAELHNLAVVDSHEFFHDSDDEHGRYDDYIRAV